MGGNKGKVTFSEMTQDTCDSQKQLDPRFSKSDGHPSQMDKAIITNVEEDHGEVFGICYTKELYPTGPHPTEVVDEIIRQVWCPQRW